ncbi:ThiF family adenylyltransferase [Amycolatopsis pigmentata]|uniref:ThiF family adenylyltransferase n=1 Tax=Amycolatopsis pigmentata TaxID=450801 RepID=A0ABW5FK88_9PSEU
MTRRPKPQLSVWQHAAIRELRALATALPNDLRLRGRSSLSDRGYLRAPIRLTLTDVERRPGGLPLGDYEDFVLWISPLQFSPPLIEVEHNRFVGFPHVLHGRSLCVYLDPAREWNPRDGMGSALDRLYNWLADAAANRFDPNTSLFHAVGGVPYGSDGLPTVVVRDHTAVMGAQPGYLTHRTNHRLDLHFTRTDTEQIQVPVIKLLMPLPLGIGHTFTEVLTRLDDPLDDRWQNIFPKHPPQSPAFLTALAASASRRADGSTQMFILTVPHPTGGPPHLLAGRLPADAADQLRRHVHNRLSPPIDVSPALFDPRTPVEWCPVSDERDSVTTRRDATRPVNAFRGKTVHLWGCGGLGSWIAEFVARAGAQRLVLCDPGSVTGGLLVRQNFAELDIGNSKATALRNRILALRDDIEVDAHIGATPDDLATSLPSADVIIDATISHAIGQFLDGLTPLENRPCYAQVATDVKTGTLGILTISPSGEPAGANEIDRRVGQKVLQDGSLEPFHTFWTDIPGDDELVPTRGCSIPTFHGSAADMAAIAATLTSLLGTHLAATESVPGTHLIALPHSPASPSYTFIQSD